MRSTGDVLQDASPAGGYFGYKAVLHHPVIGRNVSLTMPLKGGGQSEASSDASKLQFCAALQPCSQALKLFVCPRRDMAAVVTFGDAYRKIPMLPDHTWACLVVYCFQGQTWWRRYHSMLFVLPLAVSAFNRLPAFAAVSRVTSWASFTTLSNAFNTGKPLSGFVPISLINSITRLTQLSCTISFLPHL